MREVVSTEPRADRVWTAEGGLPLPSSGARSFPSNPHWPALQGPASLPPQGLLHLLYPSPVFQPPKCSGYLLMNVFISYPKVHCISLKVCTMS